MPKEGMPEGMHLEQSNADQSDIENISKKVIKVIKKKDITEPVKMAIEEPVKNSKDNSRADEEWGDNLRAIVKIKQGNVGNLTIEEMAARDEKLRQEARRKLGGK